MEKIKNLISLALEKGFASEDEVIEINKIAEDLTKEEYSEIEKELVEVENLPIQAVIQEVIEEEEDEEEKENEDTMTRDERRAKARLVNRK